MPFMPDFTYEEMEATFRRKGKKPIPKLWSYQYKLKDPYSAKLYSTIELFVPRPTLFAPYPCVLVSIRTIKSKLFFRLGDPAELDKVFLLPEEQKSALKDAFFKAKNEVEGMEAILKDLFAGKPLKTAITRLSTKELEELTHEIEDHLKRNRIQE